MLCRRCPDRKLCLRRQFANHHAGAWLYTFVRPECEVEPEPSPPPRRIGLGPRILALLASAPAPLSSHQLRDALGVSPCDPAGVRSVQNAITMLKRRGAIVGVGWVGFDDAGAVRVWALAQNAVFAPGEPICQEDDKNTL